MLREREGIRRRRVPARVLPIIERDRAAARFAEEDTGAQVLLYPEIGLNATSSLPKQLVMFDLPFNPDLLEQRIGRLDQWPAHDIQIHVPANTEKPPSRCWFAGITKGWTPEHTCPTGRAIYDSAYASSINYLAAPEETDGFDDSIKSCREQYESAKSPARTSRDRPLEIHPTAEKKAQQLAQKH